MSTNSSFVGGGAGSISIHDVLPEVGWLVGWCTACVVYVLEGCAEPRILLKSFPTSWPNLCDFSCPTLWLAGKKERARSSLLFLPDILGMTSACMLQQAAAASFSLALSLSRSFPVWLELRQRHDWCIWRFPGGVQTEEGRERGRQSREGRRGEEGEGDEVRACFVDLLTFPPQTEGQPAPASQPARARPAETAASRTHSHCGEDRDDGDGDVRFRTSLGVGV